jgi:hypothetical protein
MCKKKKRSNAQAMVEFVLVIIPLFILLMGILQILHIAVVKILVNHAVFTTARVAIVDEKMESISSVAKQSLPFKDKENISVEVLSKPDEEEIEIKLTYKMALIFPIISKIIKEMKKLPTYDMPIEAEYSLPKESFIN